jgi:hypothetical protein
MQEEITKKERAKENRRRAMAKAREAKKKKKEAKSLEEHMQEKNIMAEPSYALPETSPNPDPKDPTGEMDIRGGVQFVPRPNDKRKDGTSREVVRVVPIVQPGKKVRVRVKDLHEDPKKQVGYYDLQRMRAGDVFELDSPLDFSENWMEVVDESVPINRKKIHIERKEQLKDEKVSTHNLNVI